MKLRVFVGIVLQAMVMFGCGSSGSSNSSDVAQVQDQVQADAPVTDLVEADVAEPLSLAFPVIDTNQTACYSDHEEITCPSAGEAFFGQDGQYQGLEPGYADNGDGTVTDLKTGLIWEQKAWITVYEEASTVCADSETGGFTDWRVPTIKELYSLIDFTGRTGVSQDFSVIPDDAVPYIDTDYFTFFYGTEVDLGDSGQTGGRYIDSQYISSTEYVHKVMNNQTAFFGVNFADGRIKGYGVMANRSWFLACVRGRADFGVNDFQDNQDDTISDLATGLTWMRQDSGSLGAGDSGDGTMDWGDALAWCEGLEYGGKDDWRLPNAKELESLVDYSRAPDTSDSAAIDPLFEATPIVNEAGQEDFAYYWTGTTHLDGPVTGSDAAYVAFGRALGYMDDEYMDVHGAGVQKGDPKSAQDPNSIGCGNGPQGDCRRVYNMVRCVRGGLGLSD